MPLAPPAEPPQILQVYRDFLKQGAESAYREIEEDAARICARLGCPNPYLAIESLGGPSEVWYLNGYRSAAHEAAVAEGYRHNAPLMAALGEIPKRKADLILVPLESRAIFRQDLTRGSPWCLGEGRFLAIAVTKSGRDLEGTVFEASDGTHLVVAAAQSQEEASVQARAAGAEARVFAVRPAMSMPARDWIARDPDFWQTR
jgi:hypothetical protein